MRPARRRRSRARNPRPEVQRTPPVTSGSPVVLGLDNQARNPACDDIAHAIEGLGGILRVQVVELWIGRTPVRQEVDLRLREADLYGIGIRGQLPYPTRDRVGHQVARALVECPGQRTRRHFRDSHIALQEQGEAQPEREQPKRAKPRPGQGREPCSCQEGQRRHHLDVVVGSPPASHRDTEAGTEEPDPAELDAAQSGTGHRDAAGGGAGGPRGCRLAQ